MRTFYRSIAGGIGLVAVAVQYWLVTQGPGGAPSAHFFSFFTILTNLLAAAAMLVPVVAPNSSVGRFLDRPPCAPRLPATLSSWGRSTSHFCATSIMPPGSACCSNMCCITWTPPLFVLDWLLFVPKGEIGWRNGINSLAFPLVYLGWTLAHGAYSSWYPYPFLDVLELGYGRVLLNTAGLILAFLVLELLLVAVDRLIRPYKY